MARGPGGHDRKRDTRAGSVRSRDVSTGRGACPGRHGRRSLRVGVAGAHVRAARAAGAHHGPLGGRRSIGRGPSPEWALQSGIAEPPGDRGASRAASREALGWAWAKPKTSVVDVPAASVAVGAHRGRPSRACPSPTRDLLEIRLMTLGCAGFKSAAHLVLCCDPAIPRPSLAGVWAKPHPGTSMEQDSLRRFGECLTRYRRLSRLGRREVISTRPADVCFLSAPAQPCARKTKRNSGLGGGGGNTQAAVRTKRQQTGRRGGTPSTCCLVA